MRRLAALASALAALALAPRLARADAQVTTCVAVESGRGDAKELARLVRAEVARHPTHSVVEKDCATHLVVELVELKEGKFLTGHVDAQVPYRIAVDPTVGIANGVEDLLRVVLHSDPLVLRGPEEESYLAESLGKLRREGRMMYELEAFELGMAAAGDAWQLPGLALRVRREVGPFHVGLRVAGAYRARSGLDLAPTADIAGHAEVAIFSSEEADTAFYGSLLVGLEHQRFAGPAPLVGPGADGSAMQTGLSFGLRGGLEVLRTTSVRFDVYAQALLPAFKVHDVDGGVIDAWVPGAMLGAGAVF
jgi:hypothetical protein